MHWSTEDWHTAGEPFRIVENVPTHGATVAERRVEAITGEADGIRRFLCLEPRGHDDMYGGFITPGDDEGADFGVLFWHKDGFSTACGHGTIALGAWAVRTGRVPSDPDGETVVTIDVPSGRVQARVRQSGGHIEDIVFRNVESRVLERGIALTTSRGEVVVDLVFGGAVYATLPASAVGLEVTPEHTADLIAIGREIKWALNEHPSAQLEDSRLSGVYGTILFGDLGRTAEGPHQRNVTVFADGEVDRSPCGSGTAARVALLAATGELADGEVLTHDSIIGTRFLARIADRTDRGVIPEVSGIAHRVGTSTFELDEGDPLPSGFSLR
ncbi:proline racemase family protein [Microbacterium arabinogalactanolyticum]|uniref:proline racemase family protein n=1 Tax=Microbacterium arabinogalactanolyticum TaxID=69365 RepID=UPI002553C9D8|nr:proline racemase family protein [Microbacterium arabinogalactanolyticum]GLC86306.1 proline racemase [Microbacterium arabinogalactanolyticum]